MKYLTLENEIKPTYYLIGGASIEQERDGTWSIYRQGNPFATISGFKSAEDAADAATEN
jgi:hypothetical protein